MANKQDTDARAKETSAVSLETGGLLPEASKKNERLEKENRSLRDKVSSLENEVRNVSLELLSAQSSPEKDCAFVDGQWYDIDFKGSLKEATYAGWTRHLEETQTTLVLKKKEQ